MDLLGPLTGPQSVAVGLIVIVATLLIREWLKSWATARGALGAQQALEARKHELSADLERIRADLAREAERHRFDLQRSLADHEIGRPKIHEACAALYAAFLRAQSTPFDLSQIQTDVAGNVPIEARREMLANQARKASEIATQAFSEWMIYLPDAVLNQARAVVFAFWEVSDERTEPTLGRESREAGQRRRALSEALAAFQSGVRSVLVGSRPEELPTS